MEATEHQKEQIFVISTWKIEERVENIDTRVIQLDELVRVEFCNFNPESETNSCMLLHFWDANIIQPCFILFYLT